MNNIALFFVFITFSLGLTSRNKPVLPIRIPATSMEQSDTTCSSDSLIGTETHKIKKRFDTLLRPCDCGGPGWKKIAFFDFSQQECPLSFSRLNGKFNSTSCQVDRKTTYYCTRWLYYISSLPLPVKGRSYSRVCGRVRGHGYGWAFENFNHCHNGLETPYVSGMSLTHGPAGRRRHIWTFAAAWADGHPTADDICACSNTNIDWTYVTPHYVGNDYFCDSNTQHYQVRDDDDDLWDGEGCHRSSSCCDWNKPPYFCQNLYYNTSEDMEVRLFSYYKDITSVSLIEIFVN